MVNSRALVGSAWGLILVATFAACESEDAKRTKALAGTYVFEVNEGEGGSIVHQRNALTLRVDNHWTEAREFTMGGQDMLAAQLVGDTQVPAGYSDSGTFALKGVILSQNSQLAGVTQYTVSGDTLWIRGSDRVALAKAVTSVDPGLGPEGFYVRQR